jgi:hypothetical protein
VVVKTLGPESYVDVVYAGADMAGPDAAPLVDFAAGLAVAQGGAMDRMAPGTFLLVPPGMPGPGAAGRAGMRGWS